MASSRAQWICKTESIDESAVELLQSKLGLTSLVTKLLVHKGFVDPGAAEKELKPSFSTFTNPFQLQDMQVAVDLIIQALNAKDRILVWADYDVDGTTAGSYLAHFFSDMGVEVELFQPDRFTDGYGIHAERLREVIQKREIGLVISVDCGITSIEAAKEAKALKVPLVITDHHLPKECLPEADAVVNPNRKDDTSGCGMLAGVGVAFYLSLALRKVLRDQGYFENRREPNLREHLDLVAIGTIADMAPLIGPNRVIVKEGLKQLAISNKPGLNALLEVSGLSTSVSITCKDIGFSIGPRINAAGRLGEIQKATQLLRSNCKESSTELAELLEAFNKERKKLQAAVWKKALENVEAKLKKLPDCFSHAVVAYSDDWHEGVLGIIAAKLTEKYQKPAVVISFASESGLGKASVRSFGKINILKALEDCSNCLQEFGGHAVAAGLSVKKEDVETFVEKLNSVLRESTTPSDYCKELEYSCEVNLEDISQRLVYELDLLGPFGEGNPLPLFKTTAVVERAQLLKGRHLKLFLKTDARSQLAYEAIGFGLGDSVQTPAVGSSVEILFSPEVQEWRGRSRLQLKLVDCRAAQYMNQKAEISARVNSRPSGSKASGLELNP